MHRGWWTKYFLQFHFNITSRFGILSRTKCIMKNFVKFVPVIGWAWWFAEYGFITRNWTKDKDSLSDVINGYCQSEVCMIARTALVNSWAKLWSGNFCNDPPCLLVLTNFFPIRVFLQFIPAKSYFWGEMLKKNAEKWSKCTRNQNI